MKRVMRWMWEVEVETINASGKPTITYVLRDEPPIEPQRGRRRRVAYYRSSPC